MEASMSMFDKEHAAREKYIYFICGVAGALLAYLGKDYRPAEAWTIHDTLTISTLSCLFLSFVSGLARILTYIHALSFNREYITAMEGIKRNNQSIINYIQAEASGGTPITIGEGKFISRGQLEKEIENLVVERDKKLSEMKRWHGIATTLIWLCHIFLIGGFVLLILSKLPNDILTKLNL